MAEDFQGKNRELQAEIERLKQRISELETDKNLPSNSKIEQQVFVRFKFADTLLESFDLRLKFTIFALKIFRHFRNFPLKKSLNVVQ